MKNEITVGDLAHRIADIMQVDLDIETESQRIRPEMSEVERLCCDNQKILDHTQWMPECNLNAGIKLTIDWLSEHLNIYKPELYNV